MKKKIDCSTCVHQKRGECKILDLIVSFDRCICDGYGFWSPK